MPEGINIVNNDDDDEQLCMVSLGDDHYSRILCFPKIVSAT